MGLATVQDVKRILRQLDVDNDTDLLPLLEEAEELVRTRTRRNFDQIGTITEKFFNVRGDSFLYVRDYNPTVTMVNAFVSANATPAPLVLNQDYQVENHGCVQILFQSTIPTGDGLGSYMNASGYAVGDAYVRVLPRQYARVEITYTAAGVVPPSIREATALIAAKRYSSQVSMMADMQSEHLGDYSYTRPTKIDPDGIPIEAERMLRRLTAPKVRSV